MNQKTLLNLLTRINPGKRSTMYPYHPTPRYRHAALAIIVSTLLLTACSLSPEKKTESKPIPLAENYVLPSRVAILPFNNKTSYPEAAVKVRRIFYNYFSSLNYRDTELYTIDSVFEENNWLDLIANEEELPWQEVCQALNVDGFITGTVREFGKMYAVLYAQTEVSMAVQFRSCSNGGYIWEEEEQETKRDGDIPFSPTGLAAALVSTYMKHQDVTALEVAAKISMKLTLNMPNPGSLLAVPPEIKLFVHNAKGRLLLPDETLKVVLMGESGNRAFWSIPNISDRMKMQEKEPGIYVGEYTVKAGDRAVNAQLNAFLVSQEKAESRWVDILESVTLGKPTVIPNVISENMVLSAEQSPYLISDIVIVQPGVQLEILPGTHIWSERAGILVNGQVIAKGEASNKISFRSLNDNPWKGIVLNQGSAPSLLEHVEISNADIALNAFKSSAEVNGLVLDNNRWGIVTRDSELVVKNSLISHSHQVGISSKTTQVTLLSNYISYNKAGGAQFEGSEVEANNNAIFANGNWQIRNLDSEEALNFGANWWGTADVDAIKLVGKVEVNPLLEKNPANLTNN